MQNAATFVLQDDLGPQPLEQLLQATRLAVESFYEGTGGGAGKGQPQEPKKEEGQWSLRQQVLASRAKAVIDVDLTNKTTRELVELLRHRDDTMKANAAGVLEKALRSLTATDPARVSTVEELRKNGIRPLVEILGSSTTNAALLLKAVVILIAILNGADDVRDRIRQIGGLGPILSHVASEDSALVKHVLILVTELALNEQNQDGFRRTGMLDKVVPAMANPDAVVRLYAAEALVNLTASVKTQEIIAKANALPLVLRGLKSTDDQFQLQSLLLLYNLSHCPMVKANFAAEDLAMLLSFADARKLRQEPITDGNLTVQRYVLATLAELAAFEKHQDKMGELGAVSTLLPYLELTDGSTPLDAEALASSLEILNHLLHTKDNQYAFFKASGHERLLAILSKPYAFSEEVVIEAASIISHLSASVSSTVFSSIGVKQLNNLLDMYPQNATMHLLVAKTFASLAKDDQTARLLVANQAAQTLSKFILQSRVKQVLEFSCSALAHLAAFDAVRAYIIQTGLVSKLISFLGYSYEALLVPVTNTISLLAAHEDGLAAIMEFGGLLPLISLLQSPQPEIQEMALAAIGKVVLSDPSSPNRQDLVHKGGLAEIIALMTSPSEAVQLLVLGILKSLAKYDDMREPFAQGALMEKLRLLKDHPNVQKENSELRQTLRMLLLAVKTLQDAPPSSPSLSSSSVPLSPAGFSLTSEEKTILDTLLSSLTREQLIELVKEAVGQGANLAPTIKQFVHINVAAGKESAERNRSLPGALPPPVPEISSPGSVARSAPPPPAPAVLVASPRQAPSFSPASPQKAATLEGPSMSSLQLGKSRLRSAAARAENEPVPQDKKPPAKLTDPTYKALRHVNVEAEIEKRRHEKHQRSSRRLLKDIEVGKKRNFVLLSEGTEEGKKYWLKDPEWYVEEVQKALDLDTQMMRIIFSILETDSSRTPFDVTHAALDDKSATSAQVLAQAFLKIGFTLKSRELAMKGEKEGEDGQLVTEYTYIIMPADLPIKYILKTILVTIQPSIATARSTSNVDSDVDKSPLPPIMPLSPTAAGGLGSFGSSRPSPSLLSAGSLSSSASYGSLPSSPPSPSVSSSSTLASASSWASALSQPLPTVSTNSDTFAPLASSKSMSADFDVSALLREVDDFASSIPEVEVKEQCALCKETFVIGQMRRITNKLFCVPCHQRVTALAKQRDVKLT